MDNTIYSHPGQPNMQVEVILASQGPDQKPVWTLRLRYPRIIHGEVMTHRKFNRNAGSSRAQPASVTIQSVINAPFIPWHWVKNQPGMQGFDPLHSDEIDCAIEEWLGARDAAAEAAETLSDPQGLGLHKQVFNRLIEPFSWIDVLITTTDLENFLWLRDHEMAEPHLQDLAALVDIATTRHKAQGLIQKLEWGEWHLPYILQSEKDIFEVSFLLKLSSARTCRISYKPFGVDQIDREKDLQRFKQLTEGSRIHASPLEHQCQVDKQVGSNSVTTHFFGELTPSVEFLPIWEKGHLHGNLEGYVQFRKIFRGEVVGR